MDREKLRNLVIERRIWIYMVGRWQRDFEYAFPELAIEGYIDDRIVRKQWNGKTLHGKKGFMEEEVPEDVLIVCCYPRKFNDSIDLQLDFSNFDIVYAEDVFFMLDKGTDVIEGGGSIIVWGTGKVAERILPELNESFKIDFFIDSDESKHEFHGYEVKSPKEALSFPCRNIIVIASSYYSDISAELMNRGLKEGENFLHYKKLALPSSLFLRTWNSNNYYDLECHTMLHHLDILEGGNLNCCCTTFMLESLGNLLERDFKNIWNSKWHRIFCISILNKTYCFCRRDLCPALVSKESQEYREEFIDIKYPEIEEHPSSVNICIDNTCNLYCESCRDKIKIAGKKQIDLGCLVAGKIKDDILPYVNFIMMAGNGEVFLSKVYKKIWLSRTGKHAKYFQILTNGILFTPEVWNEFKEGRNSSVFLCVSIDAATKKTYEHIRRGGNWDCLMKNMRFAGELRRKGEIKYFRLNFVVQRKNYKEIPRFIELAKSFNADRVLFTRILNWGTYTNEAFEKITMVDKRGCPKPELQEILNMPICKDAIVDIGTFNWNHVYTDTNKVGSYYLWEIDNYSNMKIEEDVLL